MPQIEKIKTFSTHNDEYAKWQQDKCDKGEFYRVTFKQFVFTKWVDACGIEHSQMFLCICYVDE